MYGKHLITYIFSHFYLPLSRNIGLQLGITVINFDRYVIPFDPRLHSPSTSELT